MKRLILGLAAAAFFGLIAIQSAHAHAALEKDCSVCVGISQATVFKPQAAPSPRLDRCCSEIPQAPALPALCSPRPLWRARPPPFR